MAGDGFKMETNKELIEKLIEEKIELREELKRLTIKIERSEEQYKQLLSTLAEDFGMRIWWEYGILKMSCSNEKTSCKECGISEEAIDKATNILTDDMIKTKEDADEAATTFVAKQYDIYSTPIFNPDWKSFQTDEVKCGCGVCRICMVGAEKPSETLEYKITCDKTFRKSFKGGSLRGVIQAFLNFLERNFLGLNWSLEKYSSGSEGDEEPTDKSTTSISNGELIDRIIDRIMKPAILEQEKEVEEQKRQTKLMTDKCREFMTGLDELVDKYKMKEKYYGSYFDLINGYIEGLEAKNKELEFGYKCLLDTNKENSKILNELIKQLEKLTGRSLSGGRYVIIKELVDIYIKQTESKLKETYELYETEKDISTKTRLKCNKYMDKLKELEGDHQKLLDENDANIKRLKEEQERSERNISAWRGQNQSLKDELHTKEEFNLELITKHGDLQREFELKENEFKAKIAELNNEMKYWLEKDWTKWGR